MTERVHSLRGLLLRRLWLPLLVLLLCSAVGSFALARFYAGQVYDRWLLDSAMSLSELVTVQDGRASIDITPAVSRMFSWDTADEVHGEVVDSAGARLYGDLPEALPRPAIASGNDDEAVYYDARVRGQPVRMVEVVVSAGPGHDIRLRVAETLRKRHRLERKLLLTSVPFQAAILTLAAWLAWSGTGAAARHANLVARKLASPRPDPLAPLDPAQEAPRELWPAVEAYNALLQRLDAMQDAQRRFVSNAAHQLRTPLAAMQVELESSLRQHDPQAQQLALSGTLAGLARLQHLVNQLLMLSRSEDPHGSALPLQPVDLAALARGVVERYADRALAAGVDLGYEGPDDGVQVQGDPQLLREALGNLLDNALRYGAVPGVITLGVRQETEGVQAWVDDDGAGIAEAERTRVTERFYRASSEGDGCGLGLAIVAEIAQRHGAMLKIETAPLGGARVGVRFRSR
ncbi:sensor histidine kinase [Stenotrophomonas maltophilia]|uniref:sensor histidine kinase n=1 Tax=Stenotrophomonas maltophilia TaxID=40324 RepID=UPI00066B8095|nr:sensor histidine kinase [Stenotrophomonas maltophilia]MBB5529816.1 two-component system sensor histidine kinase TctE [Stenotrophomonas maltophilia]MDZ5780178.1 sensor histidine kinase [Stenotrophomonas maltophilia]NUH61784.1 sensor histidine kinase [Stenotrophomonas maltophilia]PZS75289.1 histidine kinase [Stenotrophomonas maltophilia]HDS1624414.1 sensor histidine kinase [Stenotrophomonas maltophilia]